MSLNETKSKDSRGGERILISVPNWIGDVVMATPTLRAIRESFPDAQITHLMRPYVSQVLSGSNLADSELYWPTKGAKPSDRQATGFFDLVSKIRRGGYSQAILLTNSFRSAMAAWLARIPRRVGYARDRRGWMLSDKLVPQRANGEFTPVPAIDYYNEIAKRVGCENVSRRMSLSTTENDRRVARERLNGFVFDRPLIVLNPGANYGSAKCWPAEYYAQLADRLTGELGATVVASLSPKESQIAGRIREVATKPISIFVDLGIGPLKALIEKCDLLISNDTGPRHFAPALGIPVVTVFGSSDPRWAETYSGEEKIVKLDLDCQPCMERTCPLGHHDCMKKLPVDMVFAAAVELLEGRSALARG